MKRLLLLLLISLPLLLCARESSALRWDSLRYEVRIGYGDPFFESAMQYEFPHIGKPNTQVDYVTGHLFAEFQYSWNWWCSTGMQIDYSGQGWHDRREKVDGKRGPQHDYYNLSFMPALRFTFYRSKWVNLFCGLQMGLTVNGGTEMDLVRKTRTVCYPVGGLTALGVQVGQKGWFGSFDLGGLYALLDEDDIVMFSSRVLSLGIGYRFDR